MRRRRIIWITSFGLLLALVGFVFFTANRLPRTHLSTTMKFLKGVGPVRSDYVKQGYWHVSPDGKSRREVVALVEVFELPMSLDEAHKISRDDLKPISYTATYQRQSDPPQVLYGVVEKGMKGSIVITMTPLSPERTKVVFKQVVQPSWQDQFFDRIRKMFRA